METIFGLARTPEFSRALDETFAKFEAMPAQELFEQARQHSDGDIARFSSAWAEGYDHEEAHVAKSLHFVVESKDARLKSMSAVYTTEEKISFPGHNINCEAKCYCAVPSAVVALDHAVYYPAAA
ncbi:hypothetical protein NP552_15635 [Pseudomonas sp. 8209]|uniref:hypothetical protein n=1 Tax=Pseudomonas sp. 8209 TaxID=2967214 RepID=UPI0023642CE4|nr:hypothetical protein [Pseudomonas sp. 8209]MDD1956476.1 hypothetical protein [Pseudomonas sp. 8209]